MDERFDFLLPAKVNVVDLAEMKWENQYYL